jgi:UrcA family protein
MKVALGDLNLDRPAGQAAAQHRIRKAAAQLCGSAVSDRACIERAVERANAQMASSDQAR